MKITININATVGKVVKYFILADIVLLAGWGLIEPVFSIFVVDQIQGATLVTVGIAAGIYWLLKSFLQLPLALFFDRWHGEKDDFYGLVLGLVIAGAAAFSFVAIRTPLQLYFAKALQAVGFALYAATWPAIFSRHLDKNKVSFDWALDSSGAGLAAGVSALVGGVIANAYGFSAVFFLGAAFTMVSALILLIVPQYVFPPKPPQNESAMRNHTPANIGR